MDDQNPGNTSTAYPKVSYGSADRNSAGFGQPYKQNSGVTRGSQIIANTDGSKVILGKIPNTNDFGIAFYDPLGNLISTQIGPTITEYDGQGNKRSVNGPVAGGGYGTIYYDSNGIPLAQFDSTEVKISKAGVDVTKAPLSQLSFSSNSSFTVLLQDSYTFPSFGSVTSGTLNNGSFTTIPHNAGFIPNVNCFGVHEFPGVVDGVAPVGFPTGLTTLLTSESAIVQVSNVSGNAFFNFYYTFDATNLYLGASFQNGTNATVITSPLTINYTVFTLNAVK